MALSIDRRAAGFWAISCYFNPLSSQSRLANYRTFRRLLKVPLITVEWSHTESFELCEADADILIQVQSPDLLWQKERLLNTALAAVPGDCQRVAWLDCDIVLERPDWPAAASKALDHFAVVQLFRELCDLPRGATPEQVPCAAASSMRTSVVDRLESDLMAEEVFRVSGGSLRHGYSAGHAWAARREALDHYGFYDVRILGSGNKMMLSAAYGCLDDSIQAYHMNEREAEHFLTWARPYFAMVRGNVGSLDGRVMHLWHGDLAARDYANRHVEFAQYQFDPNADIGLDEQRCWRWTSDKPSLHAYVRGYFQSRKEAG